MKESGETKQQNTTILYKRTSLFSEFIQTTNNEEKDQIIYLQFLEKTFQMHTASQKHKQKLTSIATRTYLVACLAYKALTNHC
jgi:hypothetical protein